MTSGTLETGRSEGWLPEPEPRGTSPALEGGRSGDGLKPGPKPVAAPGGAPGVPGERSGAGLKPAWAIIDPGLDGGRSPKPADGGANDDASGPGETGGARWGRTWLPESGAGDSTTPPQRAQKRSSPAQGPLELGDAVCS